MESLAFLAAIIVLTLVALGVFAALVVIRPPRSTPGKMVVTVVAAPAIVGGAWFFLLDIGLGARLLGGVTFVMACAGLVRTWRRR